MGLQKIAQISNEAPKWHKTATSCHTDPQTELGRGGDNLFAEDVLPCVEHQLADLQVRRVDGADVDHLDVGVSGETLIAWF